jgi:hypothetical protein
MTVTSQTCTWNDWKTWSAGDVDGLRHQVADGASLEEAASHLGRSGTQSEVAAKARELGLNFRSASHKQHKIQDSVFRRSSFQ